MTNLLRIDATVVMTIGGFEITMQGTTKVLDENSSKTNEITIGVGGVPLAYSTGLLNGSNASFTVRGLSVRVQEALNELWQDATLIDAIAFIMPNGYAKKHRNCVIKNEIKQKDVSETAESFDFEIIFSYVDIEYSEGA